MKKFIYIVLLSIGLISLNSCSGTNVGEVVCDYGTVLCDVSTTLCTQIPGVPEPVCNYLDLACYNLETLCQLRDSTESTRYQTALSNLNDITAKLRQWQVSNALKK